MSLIIALMLILYGAAIGFFVSAWRRGTTGSHARLVYRKGSEIVIASVSDPDNELMDIVLNLLEVSRPRDTEPPAPLAEAR